MISVIVPVYNVSKFLPNCLESIVNQTYKDLEIILINDGSTDNSLEICKDYALKDKRIIVLDKTNGGQSSARNFGLSYAKGEYIAFVDSDDAISKDIFEKNIEIIENDKTIDFIQFPIYKNYESNNAFIFSPKSGIISEKENLFKNFIETKRITLIVCDKIFKQIIFKNLRFEEGMIFEDNYIMCNILENINKVYISDVGLYYYFYRDKSTTVSEYSLKKDLDTQKVSLRILKSLIQFPDLHEARNIILSRILNVYLSLSKNYKKREFDVLFIQQIKKLKIEKLINSKISWKDKIKLLIIKLIGIENFIKFY